MDQRRRVWFARIVQNRTVVHSVLRRADNWERSRPDVFLPLSAKDPHDLPEFRARVLVALVRLAMRGAYEEILSVADTVRESDQDWTIVRLTMLNDKPKSGKVRAGYLGKSEVGTWISRADVADFMLQQVQDAKYLRQAPAISN